jgi:hypothetical protein
VISYFREVSLSLSVLKKRRPDESRRLVEELRILAKEFIPMINNIRFLAQRGMPIR